MAQFRQNHAVVIGINDYRNGISPLKTAVNDARVLAALFQRDHSYSTTVLIDQAATLEQLINLLSKTLPQMVQADDRLLFYFAGHGIALDGDDGPAGYLIPQDAQLHNPTSFLRMQEVHDALTALPCRHLLAIFDCCFAGAFRWSSTRKLIPIPEVIHRERYDRFIRDPAWQVISSAAHDQEAWDTLTSDDRGQGQHSPFAAALIQALKGEADAIPAAKNGQPAGDGVITATELYLYLRDAIELNLNRPGQTPGLWSLQKHDKGEFIFLTPGHELNLPPAPPLDASNNPYRGLAAFEAADSDLFFGRAALTETLAATVSQQPLTIVLGASGSGKSSLVKAGLIPYLSQQRHSSDPVTPQWHILPPMRPEASPFQSLNRSLTLANLPPLSPAQSLTAYVSQWRSSRPDGILLLVIDQFEELITLCRDQQERHQFLQQLAEAITSHADRLRVVLTLRSDFEPQFRNTALESNWGTARFVIPAMSREELRQAIEAPASARVLYFEPANLVDQLLDEVVQMPGALPLLSFTLSELYLKYLKRQEQAQHQGEIIDRAITQQDYDELGGVSRSLTQRADQEYEALVKLDPAYAQTVQQVMLRMVTGVGGELTRRRVPIAELSYSDLEQQRVDQVIHQFSQARLLVNGTDATETPYVEPAHDALVRGWQRLLDWANTNQEALLLQRRLTPAATEWQRQQKSSYLWHADPRLPLLNQILQSPQNWLNQAEAEFVRRSVRQRRKNRTLRGVLIPGGLAALLIAALIARTRGEVSDLQLRAFRAENLLATDSASGLAAAIQAAGQNLQRLPDTVVDGVADNLLTAIDKARESNRFTADSKGNVAAIALSGDGEVLVSGGNDGLIYRWNPRGQEIGQPFQGDNTQGNNIAIKAVAISADGKTIVSSDRTGTIRLWNDQGQLISAPWQSRTGQIQTIAISSDGQLIISGDDGGMLQLWNQQGQLLNPERSRHDVPIAAVAISEDNQTIVSGDQNGVIRLWNLQGQLIGKPFRHGDDNRPTAITAVAISGDGQRIVTASKDTTLRLWDRQGNPIGAPFKGHAEPVNAVAIWKEGDQIKIVSGSDDETIRQWDGNGNPIGSPFRAFVNSVNAIAISPNGMQVFSGCGDGTIGIWDIAPNPVNLTVEADQGSINTIAANRSGDLIATGGNDGTVRLWDRQGNLLVPPLAASRDFIWAVAISPDDQTIASGDDAGRLYLWNRQGDLRVPPIQAHAAELRSIAITPDNQRIVTGGEDGLVRFWTMQGDPVSAFKAQNAVQAIVISADGTLLATGGDTSVQLWDMQGQLIATLSDGPGQVRTVAISPNNQRIASSGTDRQVRIWDRQGQLLQRFSGNQGMVLSVAFSPDGRWLASGGNDRTLRIWDTQAQDNSPALRTHTDKVYAVAFLPPQAGAKADSTEATLVSGGRDGMLQFLRERDWESWLNVACDRLEYHRGLWTATTSGITDTWTEIEQQAKQTCQQMWQDND